MVIISEALVYCTIVSLCLPYRAKDALDACRESLISMLHGAALNNRTTSRRAASARSQTNLAPPPAACPLSQAEPAAAPQVLQSGPVAAGAALLRCVSAPQLVPPQTPSTLRFEGLGHFRNDVLFVQVDHESRALLRQIFGQSFSL